MLSKTEHVGDEMRISFVGSRGIPANGNKTFVEKMIYGQANNGLIAEIPMNVRYNVSERHKKNTLSHGFGVLGRIISLARYRRPLLLFGVLSLISLVIGILAYGTLKPYYEGWGIYLTQAIGVGIFGIIGSNCSLRS